MFLFLILLTQIHGLVTYSNTQNSITTYLYIKEDCRNASSAGPQLISERSTNTIKYYSMSMSCFDIVDDEQFLDAEYNGNSTITSTTDDTRYICTMNVAYDNQQYCCCPKRKQFSIQGQELVALILIPILIFLILIGGCLFCLKQKIKKAEYVIIEQ